MVFIKGYLRAIGQNLHYNSEKIDTERHDGHTISEVKCFSSNALGSVFRWNIRRFDFKQKTFADISLQEHTESGRAGTVISLIVVNCKVVQKNNILI